MKKIIKLTLSLSVLAGFMFMLSGCSTVPTGATRTVRVEGVGQLHASGAGIVKADAQTTTFRIKCGVCGYESADMSIPTPKAGVPYTLNWVCPNCGHKQTIVIEVV